MNATEELIIEMMPFSKGLKAFCRGNASFAKALKIIYYDKFIALQVIITSYSPNYPEDEVIGFYVYDYGKNNPLFKQDFIVNIGKKDKDFILYTGLSDAVDGKQIKHINDFLATYGKGGYYKNTHWSQFDELPEDIKERALQTINLGAKRKKDGYVEITEDYAKEILIKLQGYRSVKNGDESIFIK